MALSNVPGQAPVSIGTTPYDPRPITQPAGSELVGWVALYWLPVEWLLAEPLADGTDITENLQLAPGAGWLGLRVTPNTIRLAEPAKSGRHGTSYSTKVSALRPALAGEQQAGLQVMQGRRCLLMLREASGRLRLVGGRESYLVCTAGYDVSNPAGRAGYDLAFAGELTQPSRYYNGHLPLATGGSISAPAAPSDAVVEVYDRRGRLRATVPAGKRLVISSPFRVAFTIQ